jgi:hypothetical protein
LQRNIKAHAQPKDSPYPPITEPPNDPEFAQMR